MNNNDVFKKRFINKYSYKLSHILGQGFSGTVYQGINQEIKQPCAIKIVQKSILNQVAHKSMILCQIQFLKNLRKKHNILQFYDCYQTKSKIYLISQLCTTDLKQYITVRGKIPQVQAIKFIQGIIRGYKQIWKAGIIHRDLKPSNIFLKDQQIKIGDFGFSIYMKDRQEHLKINIGSPLYMPLQVLQSNQYSYQGDIWTLGLIFYEMIQGTSPWKAKNQKQLYYQLQTYNITNLITPLNISNKSKQFLTKTLQRNITLRMKPQQLFNFIFQDLYSTLSSQIIQNLNIQSKQYLKKTIVKDQVIYQPSKRYLELQFQSGGQQKNGQQKNSVEDDVLVLKSHANHDKNNLVNHYNQNNALQFGRMKTKQNLKTNQHNNKQRNQYQYNNQIKKQFNQNQKHSIQHQQPKLTNLEMQHKTSLQQINQQKIKQQQQLQSFKKIYEIKIDYIIQKQQQNKQLQIHSVSKNKYKNRRNFQDISKNKKITDNNNSKDKYNQYIKTKRSQTKQIQQKNQKLYNQQKNNKHNYQNYQKFNIINNLKNKKINKINQKLTIQQKKILSRILGCQIHFVRYIYKLLINIIQIIIKQSQLKLKLNIKSKSKISMNQLTFKLSYLVFDILQKIQSQKILQQNLMKQWYTTKQWVKMKKFIDNYKIKYEKTLNQLKKQQQIQIIDRTKLSEVGNDFNKSQIRKTLRKYIHQLYNLAYNAFIIDQQIQSKKSRQSPQQNDSTFAYYKYQKQTTNKNNNNNNNNNTTSQISQIMKIRQQIIILDSLITLEQLLKLIQQKGWEQFEKKSKIQQIVEGQSIKIIEQKHIILLSKRLQKLRII